MTLISSIVVPTIIRAIGLFVGRSGYDPPLFSSLAPFRPRCTTGLVIGLLRPRYTINHDVLVRALERTPWYTWRPTPNTMSSPMLERGHGKMSWERSSRLRSRAGRLARRRRHHRGGSRGRFRRCLGQRQHRRYKQRRGRRRWGARHALCRLAARSHGRSRTRCRSPPGSAEVTVDPPAGVAGEDVFAMGAVDGDSVGPADVGPGARFTVGADGMTAVGDGVATTRVLLDHPVRGGATSGDDESVPMARSSAVRRAM
jgi:hypothetical protein